MPESVSGRSLAPIPLLAGVEPERLDEVAQRMWLRHARTGEVLARQGYRGDTFGLVLEDNRPIRAVFAKVGGSSSFDEPGVVRIEMAATSAAGLLPEPVREELATAVRDVVTAASLALAVPAQRS